MARPAPRTLSVRLCLLLCCCCCTSLKLYRAPTGWDATAWAHRHAAAFRSLDLLGFPPGGLWTEPQYIAQLTSARSNVFCVWDDEASLVAFACTESVVDEEHMLSLTVHPSWRGNGVARALVLASLWSARAAGKRLLTLEVRESNAAAIGVYLSCGMDVVGSRAKYYKGATEDEDALLLTMQFADDDDAEVIIDGTTCPVLEERVGTNAAAAAIRSADPRPPAGEDTILGELLGELCFKRNV
jgi:ribosomal-protein-alanine N-acetyltransferase